MHDALRVVNGVRELDVYIEQPCLSYEECVSVRRMCPLPFVIDESMDDIGVLTRIIADKSADLINLKISKVRWVRCSWPLGAVSFSQHSQFFLRWAA